MSGCKQAGLPDRRPSPWRDLALAALAALVLSTLSAACEEEFDPPSLVNNLRVLGIAAEPPDLAPGESTVLTALVAGSGAESVSYQWEWCPIDQGPDQAYACVTEGLGLPEEALMLFELGTERSAVLPYPFDGPLLQDLCFEILGQIETLGDFAVLPDCEQGLEVTVRLTVRAGEQERIAVKGLFLWFIDDPEPDRRNRNPRIEAIRTGGAELEADQVLRVVPSGKIAWEVEVDGASMELFRPRLEDEADEEIRREEILFSFFSTAGEWDRLRSYSDGETFSLEEAGANSLELPQALVSPFIDVYFVIRDGRGGQTWEIRRLEVVEPSGTGS